MSVYVFEKIKNMKKLTDNKTLSVGKLIRDLKEFEKEYSDSCVTCCLPDDTVCCITDITLDSNGDICLNIEEYEDGWECYDTGTLLFELNGYDSEKKAYMAGCGLYLNFTSNKGGSIFSYEDDNDFVSCEGSVFGEYEEIVTNGDSEYVRRLAAEISRKKKLVNRNETIALISLMVLTAAGMIYSIATSIGITGSALVENIVWIAVCIVVLTIGYFTLHYSKDDDK